MKNIGIKKLEVLLSGRAFINVIEFMEVDYAEPRSSSGNHEPNLIKKGRVQEYGNISPTQLSSSDCKRQVLSSKNVTPKKSEMMELGDIRRKSEVMQRV